MGNLMEKWLVAGLLALGAHFAASYLVPLDKPSQAEFGGLLRWVWPWSDGDSGPLGTVTTGSGFPLIGFFIAVTAASLFIIAVLAVLGWWIPMGWWRPLAVGGAVLSLVLFALFFGPTKLLPMAYSAAIAYVVWSDRGAAMLR